MRLIAIGTASAVLAGLILALITGTFDRTPESGRGLANDSGAPSLQQSTTHAQTSDSASSAPNEAAPVISQPPADTLLTSLAAINTDLDVKLDRVVSLNGTPYMHSIVYRCSDFCNEPSASVEYDLGRKYSQFTAVIGVSDDTQETDQTGTFEVFLDDGLVGTWTASFGSPQQISADVSGGLRLRLEWARSGTVAGGPADAIQAGANAAVGVSNGLPDLAWAQPTLLP